MMNRTKLLAMGVALFGTACASSRANGTRPGDMRGTEHLEQARTHSVSAATAPRASSSLGSGFGYGHGWNSGYAGGFGSGWGSSYPYYYYWDPALEHRDLAKAHAAAADILRIEYEAACNLVPSAVQGTSPLARGRIAMERTSNGVVFHLEPAAGPPDVVLTQLRCYRAFVQLTPRDGAGDDPLLLPGVTWIVHAAATSIEVMGTVASSAAIPELARRSELIAARARAASTSTATSAVTP